MKRKSFRVFLTQHHGGLWSAVLIRRYRLMFDPPPPAAMADSAEDALRRLIPQAALITEDAENLERYLWTEELELRRVEIEIHPGRPDPRGFVIARATVPIKLGYAAAKLDGAPLHRVIVPRFDWSVVVEDLAAVHCVGQFRAAGPASARSRSRSTATSTRRRGGRPCACSRGCSRRTTWRWR